MFLKIRFLGTIIFLIAVMGINLSAQMQHHKDKRMDRRKKHMNMEMRHHKLSDKNREDALAFISQYRSALKEQLDKLQDEKPELYEKILQKAYWRMKKLERLQKKNPDAYKEKLKEMKLSGKIDDLGRSYREAASEKEKIIIKKQLKPLVSEMFDYREKNRKMEIGRMEQKVEELEKSLKTRRENKDKIVAEKLDEITGQKADLKW